MVFLTTDFEESTNYACQLSLSSISRSTVFKPSTEQREHFPVSPSFQWSLLEPVYTESQSGHKGHSRNFLTLPPSPKSSTASTTYSPKMSIRASHQYPAEGDVGEHRLWGQCLGVNLHSLIPSVWLWAHSFTSACLNFPICNTRLSCCKG